MRKPLLEERFIVFRFHVSFREVYYYLRKLGVTSSIIMWNDSFLINPVNLSLVAMVYWFETIRYTRGALNASLSPESIKMDHVLSPIFYLNLKVLLGPCSAFFWVLLYTMSPIYRISTSTSHQVIRHFWAKLKLIKCKKVDCVQMKPSKVCWPKFRNKCMFECRSPILFVGNHFF